MDENQLPYITTEKLTDWKNEPTLLSLKSDFEACKTHHDAQVAKIDKWRDLLTVSGSAKPPKIKGRSSVQPKLVRRQAEWRYSALSEPFLGTDQLFSIEPRTFEDEAAAKQNQILINWQFSTKLDKIKLIDDYVRSAVDEGTCIVKLGWNRVTTTVTEEVPIYSFYPIQDEQGLQLLQQAIELKQSNPREYQETIPDDFKEAVNYYEETGFPVTAIQSGSEEQEVEHVIENAPVVEVLNPSNVYIDPSCLGDLDKALFVINTFETNKSELQKTGLYKNLDKVDWESNSPVTDPDHETTTPDDFNFNDSPRKKVIAHEYWGFYDIHGTGELVPIVATWIGNTLIRMEENPFPDGKVPFVVVQYIPIKRDIYGEADAELLEDNQRILGAVTRGMIDSLGRSANAQQGFAKGMLDPLNRKRFENGEDYEFNPSLSPNGGLIEHKYPELPQSAILMVQMQNQEAEALTGVKAFSGGLAGDAYNTRVATAIRGVLDASSKREMSILRRLAKGMIKIGEKICSMNAEFLSEQEVVRVTNRRYITIKREDLKGNFDLKVDISTAEVDNAKAQDLGFMLQTLGPNMDSSITMMILAEIAELKRMPVLAERLRTYQPQPDPLAVEQQQLEIEKLKAEIAKLQSETVKNQAMAGKTEAEAQGKAIDNVLTETGVKHTQEMEKQQAQSRGNQNLEIIKGLLKPRKEGEIAPDIDAAIGYNAISDKITNQF
jgi:hypothetical protein